MRTHVVRGLDSQRWAGTRCWGERPQIARRAGRAKHLNAGITLLSHNFLADDVVHHGPRRRLKDTEQGRRPPGWLQCHWAFQETV